MQQLRVISGMTPLFRSQKLFEQITGVTNSSNANSPLDPAPNTEKLTFQFSPDRWYELVKLLEAPPSAGLLTCYTLYKNNSIYDIYGFTTVFREGAENHYGDSGKRSSRHNWTREARILCKINDASLDTNPSSVNTIAE